MIYIDEMDSILLKVKAQGIIFILLYRQNIILYEFIRLRSMHTWFSRWFK